MCSHVGTYHITLQRKSGADQERRFHSKAVLSYMNHAAAVREWAKVRDGQDVSLERALAAFDLFVLQDEKEGFDEVRSNSKKHGYVVS